jgi:hypothetical protein
VIHVYVFIYYDISCHNIIILFNHSSHYHKMSKQIIEPSHSRPYLTIQSPLHVITNNVIVKNVNTHVFEFHTL